tara:strand:+ start:337 stop:705 length:369 start_codon:yes stop_codon:yes gene_type:complete
MKVIISKRMSKNTLLFLEECTIHTNCQKVEWNFSNLDQAFEKLIEICNELPRTEVIESSNQYWHGICRSLIFRFPDDLQLLKIEERGIIQVKSSSRVGLSDLGVNLKRINKIYKKLINKIQC